jgi:hypothetical protein
MPINPSKVKTLREKLKSFSHSLTKFTNGTKSHVENGRAVPNVLKPILVSGIGRGGTTLLMQLLGTSPQIMFNRSYPFEVRYLTYLLRWSLVLNEEWQPNENWGPGENYKHPSGQMVGPMPYTNTKLWPGKEIWSKCFETAWQEFSSALISKAENNKTGIHRKYYAEKAPRWVMEYLEQQSIPYNVICLIRDPRDVFLSINAFDKQRGFSGFGRSSENTDLDYAKQLARSYKNLHKDRTITAPNSLMVKYEQLITDLSSEAQRLSRWLDIELNPALVKKREVKFKHHMTSGSPEKSVERWRYELPKELNDFFVQELGEELRYFGYET